MLNFYNLKSNFLILTHILVLKEIVKFVMEVQRNQRNQFYMKRLTLWRPLVHIFKLKTLYF